MARSTYHSENTTTAGITPRRSIKKPDNAAPIGIMPKASNRKVLFTRPCNASGMSARR